jgi:hypothetical protein
VEKESLSDAKLIAILQLALNNAEIQEEDLNTRMQLYESANEEAQTSEKSLRGAMQLLQIELDMALADTKIDQKIIKVLRTGWTVSRRIFELLKTSCSNFSPKSRRLFRRRICSSRPRPTLSGELVS